MKIGFRKAEPDDAELLIGICNSAFRRDDIRYGECPAYGKNPEMMRRSAAQYLKFLILCDERPVGSISCRALRQGEYEIGCLCVFRSYETDGNVQAARFVPERKPDQRQKEGAQ